MTICAHMRSVFKDIERFFHKKFTPISRVPHIDRLLYQHKMTQRRMDMTGTAYMTKKIFFALGTVCTLTLYDGHIPDALQRSRDRIMEIHDRMNAYDENSEVSRINAAAGMGFVKVSEDTFKLVVHSLAYSQMTNGLYDITTRPLSALWKVAVNSKVLPLPYEIAKAKKACGYRDIIIDRKHSAVMLRRKGMQIDLGAIAKGYAADEVRRILEEEGVTEAIINFGGTVLNIGKHRRIGIQNPFEITGVTFAYADVGEKAVVTSGLYEQGFSKDGKTYHHIVDPKTGYPSESELAGVTLIGDCAEQLDALSTATFMMGMRDAIPLLNELGIEAVFVAKNGDVFSTDGFTKSSSNAS